MSFGGAGKVLQVLTATDQTERATSSSTFVTGSNTLSVTITPSSASNKILILAHTAFRASTNVGYYSIFRDATNLGNGNAGLAVGYDAGSTAVFTGAVNYLDSPNTTSATTYQLYFRSDSGVSLTFGFAGAKSSITVLEIAG